MKDLEIIVPVKNEAGNLTELARRIDNALTTHSINYGLIFIDDYSTDQTQNILKNLAKKYPIRFYTKIGQAGKAYSILEGAAYADSDNLAMIDGDLQYEPEAIPLMFQKLENSGVVIGKRQYQTKGKLRKISSHIFRTVFGRVLLGFNLDVQSGLKLFKKGIISKLVKKDVTPWTIDLPLLHKAKEMGYSIDEVEINFKDRLSGQTKVNLLRSSLEIASQALKLKFAYRKDLPVQTFITHTKLDSSYSALRTFIRWQKAALLITVLVIISGFVFNALLTVQALVSFLSTVYFIDVVFSFYLLYKSLGSSPEITFSAEELARVSDEKLPVYSILCPLYKEARVLPHFVDSLLRLNWPKDKLDVQLLLEKDDLETISVAESLHLPLFIKLTTVPHSLPKTKPKACNYGLSKAKGTYLVVFDAEDTVEPDQLKKAYLGFQKLSSQTVCLQAKLNYYNPDQNLLTRLFTAEYSLWFDLILPGLQSINTVIPLGGTSNHFKLNILRKLQGWDPFNVTEDCDLGMRLFSRGYTTAIIDSTTLEEANSEVKNWLRQRSRWIKGYLQTYLVHMRHPVQLIKNYGLHAWIFQLVIGARITFLLINPLLWLMLISYFALYQYVGPTIQSFYLSPVFYIAVVSLVFGNFLYLYSYMIGAAKRGQWNLLKYIFLVPFYWLLASFSAVIAIYQLFFKPHFWEKTIHGFHLNTDQAKAFVWPAFVRENWSMVLNRKKLFAGGALLVTATIIGNFLNFVFNAYLGRVLKFQDFALIGLTGGLLSMSSILFGAFSTTANFRGGFLIGKYGNGAGYSFWKYFRWKTFSFSIILTIVWFVSIPFLMKFFRTSNPYVFILFGAILLLGFANSVDRGFLSARLMFGSLAVLYFFDPVIKLVLAIFLVYLGFKLWTFAAVPFGIVGIFLIGWLLVTKQVKSKPSGIPTAEIEKFPKKFFAASIFSGFSPIAFLTVDILLANHYLPPVAAGQYTLLSLVGKMVYFFGGLTGPFLIPFLSRHEGTNTASKVFHLVLFSTAFLSLTGFMTFGLFGHTIIPILYGKKALAVVPYLIFFTAAVACYSVARVLINYYLVKRVYSFTALGILLTFFQVLLISIFHTSPQAIAIDMSIIGVSYLILTTLSHLGIKHIRIFETDIKIFWQLLFTVKDRKKSKLNILVFNWRDIKHKWAGGAEVYIHELAKRWVKDGNNVTLFCSNSAGQPTNEIIDDVQIIRKGGFFTVYFWAFIYYMIKFRGKFDVVIDCENGIPFFTPLYAKERKILIIHHVHQEVFRKNLIKPLAWLASFLEMKLMPLVYRNVQTITVSPSSREEIIRNNLSKAEPVIVYSGLDAKKFVPGKKYKVPLFAYIGRLQNYKSLDILIKAAKKVLQVFPHTEFVIAGDGQARKKLEGMTKELAIENKIYFTGKVTEKEKISLYQKAWGFVNPSFMEGWGITTIEANSCGTPALASNVPGLKDSVKNPHTGFLFPYADTDRLSEIMIELIKNTKLRNKLSKNAVLWAHHFSWDKSARQALALIKKPYEY